MSAPSIFVRARLLQIRICVKLLETVGLRSLGRALIVRFRRNSLANTLLRSLISYRQTFASFQQAQDYAARFIPYGHEHPDDIAFHSSIADTLRESDYPVLFYVAPFSAGLKKVFDLGGNVGNLFYAYNRELAFPTDMCWYVFDLPSKRTAGEALARQRNESRVRFSESLDEASGADLFIASGSLHYFESPLDQMLRSLSRLPQHVIVNRTPCFRHGSEGASNFHDDL